MVKGVNKTVIEINCTDNGYFERVILFINPENSHLSQKRLHSEAYRYIGLLSSEFEENVSQDTKKSESKIFQNFKVKTIIITSAIAAATGIAFLIFNIL